MLDQIDSLQQKIKELEEQPKVNTTSPTEPPHPPAVKGEGDEELKLLHVNANVSEVKASVEMLQTVIMNMEESIKLSIVTALNNEKKEKTEEEEEEFWVENPSPNPLSQRSRRTTTN